MDTVQAEMEEVVGEAVGVMVIVVVIGAAVA